MNIFYSNDIGIKRRKNGYKRVSGLQRKIEEEKVDLEISIL